MNWEKFYDDPLYTESSDRELAELGITQEILQGWKEVKYEIFNETHYPFIEACRDLKNLINGMQPSPEDLHALSILDIGGGAVSNSDSLDPDASTGGDIARIFEPWRLRAAAYLGIGTKNSRVNIDLQTQSDLDQELFTSVRIDIVDVLIKGVGTFTEVLAKNGITLSSGFELIICQNLFTAVRGHQDYGDILRSSPKLLETLYSKNWFRNRLKREGIHLSKVKGTTLMESLDLFPKPEDKWKILTTLWEAHDILAFRLASEIIGIRFTADKKGRVYLENLRTIIRGSDAQYFLSGTVLQMSQLIFLSLQSRDFSSILHFIGYDEQ